ncbi:MAG: uracil-DNA glycosylase [Rhodospirillales bacterium]|nr:uracil-DNA glycosylase [Rhodospirillales bacterium]
MTPPSPFVEPGLDCALCPRLQDFRIANRAAHSDWHNAPVPSFGPQGTKGGNVKLLIVGLAPGLKGANLTGRPFTGDYAGDLLYATLLKYGFAEGEYQARADDGLNLLNCRITNAVKCVPPENKPIGSEVKACGEFLKQEIQSLKNLKLIIALGTLAHGAVLVALGEKKSSWKFGHREFHDLPNGLVLADSYHCSRYNTNTRRLTEKMFHAVFEDAQALINKSNKSL